MRSRRAPGSPIPHTGKHQFLQDLHDLLRPERYLEIGFQFGNSMWVTREDTSAYGVDPQPLGPVPPNGMVYTATSDEFFAQLPSPCRAPFDLAFIDGSHLAEDALRDFIGVERLARPDGRTVAVFDDVLPYSADIAERTPLPGDWAGDVWKITNILETVRPDLTTIPVHVEPTGALVVLGLDPASTVLPEAFEQLMARNAREFSSAETAAGIAAESRWAIGPADALHEIRSILNITEA